MRNNRVLNTGFARGARHQMFFTLCILVFSSTTIRQLDFITKMPTFGLYEYKVEGSGCGFNGKQCLAETDSLLIKKFDMF